MLNVDQSNEFKMIVSYFYFQVEYFNNFRNKSFQFSNKTKN